MKRRHLVGTLRNQPVGIPRLDPGDRVKFQRDHVIDIDWEADCLYEPAEDPEGATPSSLTRNATAPTSTSPSRWQKIPSATTSLSLTRNAMASTTTSPSRWQKMPSCLRRRNRWIARWSARSVAGTNDLDRLPGTRAAHSTYFAASGVQRAGKPQLRMAIGAGWPA